MTDARFPLARGVALAFAVIASSALFLDVRDATALEAQGGAAAPAVAAPASATPVSTPPSKSVQSLERGIAAYKKSAMADAVGALSSALSSGGLDNAGTARALYYRGLAYRKQGRSALAISDLTNALWLNGGLNETERQGALAARSAAYKDAGIADPGAPEVAGRENASPPSAAASDPTTSPSASTGSTSSVERSASAAAPTATAPAPVRTPTHETALAPEPTEEPASNNPLSGIGTFFGNLFSGNAAQQQQAGTPPPGSRDVTTASTGPSVPNASSEATSSWNSATEIEREPAVARSKTRGQRTAAVAPDVASDATPPPAAPASAPKGKYKLQVAAVRSRDEAEGIATRINTKHGSRLGRRTAVVDEAVFGNMGKFYRVNVGPYASAAEPEKLCASLRGSGFDCLVVSD